MVRHIRVLAGLTLAVALPAAAHTFAFSPGSAAEACLAIGNTTYRLARGAADVTVRIEPSAAAPNVRIQLAETPDEADFILVDDGAPPACGAAANVKNARIAAVMLALYLTLPLLASEDAFAGFDASISATIAGAIVVAACGALLMARRNRTLAAEVARLEERVEELADRNWELREAEGAN